MNMSEEKMLPAKPAPLDLVDCAVLAYLAIPNVIFLSSWIVMPWGPVAALVVGLGALYLMRGAQRRLAVPRLMWAIFVPSALLWLALSGVGHLVYANPDWLVRDVVLHDLATLSWPVQYVVAGMPDPVLLRAPLGYFLPTALIAHLLGYGSSQLILFLWTLIGVVLSFALLAARTTSTRAAAVLVGVFVCFSGLDVVGSIYTGDIPELGDHLEWWAILFQYSSNTTQLFWVPNHALPAWLVTLWLLKVARERMPLAVGISMVALTPVWSPLAAIGLAPLVAVVGLRDGLRALRTSGAVLLEWLRELANPAMILVVAATLVLIDPFLLISSGSVPAGWVGKYQAFMPLIGRVALFVMLEFGIYWVLMFSRYRFDLLLTTSGVILLLLPWYRFGPGSDLTMRASIPALVVFAVRIGEWFVERLAPATNELPAGNIFASLAMVAFVLGMFTPFEEMVRPFTVDRNPVDVGVSVYGIMHGNAPHYLTERKGAWSDRFLATPAPSSPERDN